MFELEGIYECRYHTGETFYMWYEDSEAYAADGQVFDSMVYLDNGMQKATFLNLVDFTDAMEPTLGEHFHDYDLESFWTFGKFAVVENAPMFRCYVGDDFWGELAKYDVSKE